MLLLRRKVANPTGAGCVLPLSISIPCADPAKLHYSAVPQDAEMMRLQLLGDPTLMRQLQEVRFHSRSLFTH